MTTYSATLIRNLGYAPKKAALMNTPSGAVSIFFTLLVGYGIRTQSHRWAWIIGCIIPAYVPSHPSPFPFLLQPQSLTHSGINSILGGALMSFLPTTNKSGILAGIYLVNAVVAPLPIFYNWTVSNIAGTTKRAFAAAIISGSFSLGNIIGPQTFKAKDAPEYRPAKIAVMATQAACAVTTFSLFLWYVWRNKMRDNADKVGKGGEGAEVGEIGDKEAWSGLTDWENKKFRYVY